MAGDGTAALGAPEIAGTMVNPRGFTKKMSVGAVGGVVGAVAATAVARRSSKASDVPAFGRVAYLAASETEVALIKTKSGALKLKVTGEALVRAPRAEIETVALKDGKLIAHLRLQFANGTVWEFDVPKIGKKNAKQLVLALDGDVT
jgi:RNase P/RNase MRP subunit p29